MSKFKRAIAFAMLCAGVSSAYASSHQPLPDCVDLAADRQAARFGSQYLLVKDGDAHYRIGFSGSCSAIALSSRCNSGPATRTTACAHRAPGS